MRRLGRAERIVLLLFVPLWIGCFGAFLRDVVRRTPYPPCFVHRATSPDDHPRVAGFVAGFEGAGELAVGDRLLAVNEHGLAGAGQVGFSRAVAAAPPGQPLALVVERKGARRELRVEAPSYRRFWPRAVAAIAFAVSAFSLLLNARRSPMVRSFAFAHAAAALFFTCTFSGSGWRSDLAIALHVVSLGLAAPLALRSALLFPHGVGPSGALARYGPWLFAAVAVFDASRFYELPFSRGVGALGTGVLVIAYFAVALGILTATMRRADAVARRQIKWVVLGAYLAALPPLAFGALAAWDPRFQTALAVAVSSLALIPVSQMIAISRYNLFDVDRLISTSASYTLLLAPLLALLVGFTSGVARAFGDAVGLDTSLAQMFVVLGFALLLVPADLRLRPQIDRAFFAERYALERGIDGLLAGLAACTSPQELLTTLGRRLEALLRPISLAIHVRTPDGFAPAFVTSPHVPSPVDAQDSLIATLERLPGPLLASTRAERARLAPFDRAALETLGVPCVVPVRHEGRLVAMVCLGAKQSGDVYTPTDRALLSSVAAKVSDELDGFEQERVLDATRELAERLRSYVGAPIAERLRRGEAVELGESEVSVLFVDMRGYTAYAEDLPPERIFSTINRFTRVVSETLAAHGGTVVEFGGDGMMAVFGAPGALAHKERAAVEAGRAVVLAVAGLTGEGGRHFGVGVGIATGTAFVGSVRSADRLFWTAIGNNTNLAARLQALTSALSASLVVDEATWRAAGDAARDFVRHADVAIRGRRKPETIYALGIGAAAG